MASLASIIGNASLASGAASGVGSSVLTSLSQGDVNGAIGAIADVPGQMLDTFAAAGGINPGDAFRGINAREDALQNWSWYCLPPPITNANSLSLAGAQTSVSLPWYYVQKATLPWRAIGVDSTSRNGRQTHYPTNYSVGDISLELFMDSSNQAMMWAKAWQGQVLGNRDPSQPNNQGGWGLPANFKKNLQFVLLNVKRKKALNIKYINCMPSDFSALDMVSADGAPLVLTLTLKVEDIDVTVTNDIGVMDALSSAVGGYAMSAISGLASPILNQLGDIAGNII